MSEPFLKWAGNKLPILGRIKATLPPGKRLIEPFLGSGAVFLGTDYPEYILNDNNADLINVYNQLQNRTRWFIDRCASFFDGEYNTPAMYLTARNTFRQTHAPQLFPYLNRHCFNGLWRESKKSGFNVPFGSYKNPYFPSTEMLACANKLASPVTLVTGDFAAVMSLAGPGDVIYCDPPYVPLSVTASFTNYSGAFLLDDQQRLAREARAAQKRGATVLISNHDTPVTRELYAGAEITAFGVQRHISCNGQKREVAPEILALFRG
jgi:DNA adenine methylase